MTNILHYSITVKKKRGFDDRLCFVNRSGERLGLARHKEKLLKKKAKNPKKKISDTHCKLCAAARGISRDLFENLKALVPGTPTARDRARSAKSRR
jgi:hypothetical protein